ncbi:MAG: 5-(carboxyamino)imidazole ribonucleotide mutase [Sporomusaceae bacterium]|nr:5-(carboxyamino)imidazole ribonucleotide mutase [Sporomusaceae bacterium]
MKVAIIMGSNSDWPKLKPAYDCLKDFAIETEVIVASAHRTPEDVKVFAEGARDRGIGVIIAAAGAAAHLAGVVASFTTLPVVAVPIEVSLGGVDSLLAMVQMPSGIPVATMAINGAKNAALFAAQILAVSNKEIQTKLEGHRQTMAAEVREKNRKLQEQLGGE